MVEHELDKLVPDPFGLRVHYDDGVVKNLAGSILQNGIVTPLLVRPIDDKYQIIDGNYRYRALKHIGWDKPVPVNTVKMSDEEALLRAVIANWHRKSFGFVDKARAVKKLRDHGLSPEEIAIRLELKHPKSIYHYLGFEEKVSGEAKEIVVSSPRVTRRHGEALAKLVDKPNEQRNLAERIVTEHLSGPKAVREADKILEPEKPESKPKLHRCGLCGLGLRLEEAKKIILCTKCLDEFTAYLYKKGIKYEED